MVILFCLVNVLSLYIKCFINNKKSIFCHYSQFKETFPEMCKIQRISPYKIFQYDSEQCENISSVKRNRWGWVRKLCTVLYIRIFLIEIVWICYQHVYITHKCYICISKCCIYRTSSLPLFIELSLREIIYIYSDRS